MDDECMHADTFAARVQTKIQTLSQSISVVLDDGKQKKSIHALDGIRGVACLSVVIFHLNMFAALTGIWSPHFDTPSALAGSIALMGDSGVKLFFLLSGFLLFLPYAKALLFDSNWPSLRRFYIRRVFRILPGYYIALGLIFLFLGPEVFQPANWHNLWMFITLRNDFSNSYQMPIPVFWTLAIEFQFYLLLPLLAWLMRPLVQQGTLTQRMLKLTFCLLVLLAWGLLTRYWGLQVVDTPRDLLLPATADALKPYIYGKAGKYFDVFAIGMLVCMVYVCLQNMPSAERTKKILSILSPLLFLYGLLELLAVGIWNFYVQYVHYTLHFLDPYQNFLVNYKDMFVPVGYGLGYGLCLFAVLHGPHGLKRPFEWAPLRWVGLTSLAYICGTTRSCSCLSGTFSPGFSI